jgi:hypothetical protein
LNREGHPDLPYSHPISPHCGIYLFLKEGAAEIAAWRGREFELLVEIVNPIPAEALEFQATATAMCGWQPRMCVGSSLWILLAMAGISAVPRGWHPRA